MANKITTVVDFVTDGAKSSLGSLKQSISDAEGAGGKLKATFGGVGQAIQDNASAIAIGAGGALVAFGIKAAGAFTDVSKAAIDLAASTGLSTEAASRWIAVGDDYQVTAQDLAAGIGKIGKTLDSGKWEKYGIATRGAGGEARTANDILTDSLAKLSSVRNETERARIGNDLFGKGYAKLAPLVGHTKDEYQKMLSSVEDGQVITDAEAKKGEAWRHAEDDLGDALRNVTLNIGQQMTVLAPLIEAVSKYIMLIQQLDNTPAASIPFLKDLTDIKNGWDAVFGSTKDVKELTLGSIDDMDRANKDLAQGYADTGDRIDHTAESLDAMKRSGQMTTDSIKRGLDLDKVALDNLKGGVDDHAAWTNLELAFDDVKQKGKDAFDAAAAGSDDARTKLLEYSAALDGLKDNVISYATEVLKLPVEQVTKIVAAVDPQSLDEAEALLAALTRNREVSLDIIAHGGAGYGALNGARAAGGPVSAGGNYLVGENGPEVVHMGGNGTVIPNGAMGGNVTVHVATGPFFSATDMYRTGQMIANALAEYNRRNG